MWLPDPHTPASTQAGDIAFYETHGSLLDDAIVLRTGSPLVHVAIVEQVGATVAATSGGITRQEMRGNEYAVWRPAAGYATARLVAALDFLSGEVGKPYGYADIVNQVLLLSGKDPVLLDKSEDCSDLATKFLWIAGVPLPAPLILTNRVTPGGLYHTLDGVA